MLLRTIKSTTPVPFDLDDGRDELNLAEFPLAALLTVFRKSENVGLRRSNLRFKVGNDHRRLTISASEVWTSDFLDDEVILGLIQLARQNRFASRESISALPADSDSAGDTKGEATSALKKSLKRLGSRHALLRQRRGGTRTSRLGR
jgi:hypothetical protein